MTTNKYLRITLALVVFLGVLLLAGGRSVWAGQDNAANAAVGLEQGEPSLLAGPPGPGSVKPPPRHFKACKDGLYSVGGVVTIEIKNLKPGYCIEAVLWNPRFQFKRIPDEAGKVLAHMLFLRVYYQGRLTYELPIEDGSVEACYAVPPEKQAQFYFYDFYGVRFKKLTHPPKTWEALETRVDADNKTACAFTQVSGVYALVGK
ncbi:MAG: hypothetical protein HUU11_07345 [Anaerolineales bacterium]|nr:hypothetical protein [Anaerolineales bacterium]